MSITVRLIFWGLIGFAPNPQGEKGMAALLVDPSQVQTSETPCPVPRHLSAIYLLEGECTGDCARISSGHEADALRMGFKIRDRKPVALDGQYLGLAWLLDREDLDLSGDEDEKLKLRKPFLDLSSDTAPTNENRASYFKWVQNLDSFVKGSGRIRTDCIKGEATCPLHGRFKVQGGKTSACHLFHDPEPANSTSKERSIRLITYTKPNKQQFTRAVADAVLVEFTEEGGSVVLTSKGLPGRTRPDANARIKPDAQGKLTLVVVNFPPISSHTSCHQPHSDFLYSLLDVIPTSRTMRDDTIKTIRRGPAGSCEPESLRIASLFRAQGGEPPHASTACDNAYFKP